MFIPSDSISVLVVDEEPDILSFFANILDSNGIRALLARNPHEAIGIAKRGYVPIDLVISDVSLRPELNRPDLSSGHDLVDNLRNLRPDVRALFMSAYLDAGIVRIELMDRGQETISKGHGEEGLIDSIRRAATAPMVHHAGSRSTH